KKIQHGTVPPPRIFGHETAGTIVQIGNANSQFAIRNSQFGFRVGDRVALHHHVPCLDCHYCRHHAFAQCATYKRTGITAGFEPAGGGYAEYVRVMPFVLPGVVKIPAKNSFAEGAMLEPVNTVLKAVRRLNLLRGDTVLVAGQGPIGLMFTRLLQLAGARVLATDLLESRLKLARKFGAKWTHLVQTRKSKVQGSEFEGRSRVPTTLDFGHRTLDSAIVAVPSDAAVHQALQLVRGGGQVLLFAHTRRADGGWQMADGRGESQTPRSRERERVAEGRVRVKGKTLFDAGEVANPIPQLPIPNSQIDLASICLDEKDLIGSYSSDFTLQAEVARLVFSRRLDVRGLITHCFPLEQTAAAVSLAAAPTSDSLKILVAADQ
ncbi:MAG: alcohol dehydrogenase catalytic domain-containing protein, partial [Thermoplasmata archaeon]